MSPSPKPSAPCSLIVIGETFVNITYRCFTPAESQSPYASFDEQYLLRRGKPVCGLQGALPIAEYWRKASNQADASNISLVTAVATDQVEAATIPEAFRGNCNKFRGSTGAPVVLRVVGIPQPRIETTNRRERPHLRIDWDGDKPFEFDVDKVLAGIRDGRRVCLVRSVTPRFFGTNPEQALAAIHDLQKTLAAAKVELILDVRPLPARLQIVDKSTIVSSTIQRLRELTDLRDPAKHDDTSVVLQAFWKLTPARGLLCFASFGKTNSALFCLRDRGDPSKSEVFAIEIPKPDEKYFPDAGSVKGGDAFIAAFLAEWLDGGSADDDSVVSARAGTALGKAGVALLRTMESSSPLIEEVSHSDLKPLKYTTATETDAKGRRLDWITKILENAQNGTMRLTWATTGVIAPGFLNVAEEAKSLFPDPLRRELDRLVNVLTNWRAHPGRDVIAVYGQSRAGKEFPLKEILEKQFKCNPTTSKAELVLGPINQFEFLARVDEHTAALQMKKHSVLLIDEIVEGEAARPLLNLLAEKRHKGASFADTLVILITSVRPERVLTDIRGRLMDAIEIPPLQQRWMELPFSLPLSLNRGLRYWGPPEKLVVSFRLMSALLHHDYQDHGVVGHGMNQQNFRAFEDILASTYRSARGRGTTWEEKENMGRAVVLKDYDEWLAKGASTIGNVRLTFDDLPPTLRDLQPTSKGDDHHFVYTLRAAPDGDRPKVEAATEKDIELSPTASGAPARP